MLLLLPFLRLLLFFLLILILRLFLLLLLLLLLHNPWVHLPLAAEASLITSHEFRRNPRSMFAKRQQFIQKTGQKSGASTDKAKR